MAIAWVRKETGSLDLLFASLAGLSAVIAVVALLLPNGDRKEGVPAVTQPAPAE